MVTRACNDDQKTATTEMRRLLAGEETPEKEKTPRGKTKIQTTEFRKREKDLTRGGR